MFTGRSDRAAPVLMADAACVPSPGSTPISPPRGGSGRLRVGEIGDVHRPVGQSGSLAEGQREKLANRNVRVRTARACASRAAQNAGNREPSVPGKCSEDGSALPPAGALSAIRSKSHRSLLAARSDESRTRESNTRLEAGERRPPPRPGYSAGIATEISTSSLHVPPALVSPAPLSLPAIRPAAGVAAKRWKPWKPNRPGEMPG